MPKRTDLKKILIIGSGPIIIGQACEFDYSGSQACKALKEEGYSVILVNSNPATIMTDPEMADRTYIEPITPEIVEKIIARERPDAILPTLGGQTGLNTAVFLARAGVFEKYGVEVLGASAEAIARAEDRDLFKQAMLEIGVGVPDSGIATTVEEGMAIGLGIGFPLILRPAFTLGGTGGSIAYNKEELEEFLAKAIEYSPVGQVLVERSVLGWKEIEFEVMRDAADNVIIVTSMENVDAMGVHTGDSAVVAPAQTLTAPEYTHLTALCRKIIRKIDVTGGVNIQFAVSPDNGEVVIIEVNPRLSRSSALASKATGFPIARVATKLAVGFTLDEVKNDVTGRTSALHEPTIDYCVFKISRFTFEKFPLADPTLNTSMKAVGEAMSIGRTFKEAFQKGLRSLETGRFGFGADGKDVPFEGDGTVEKIREKLRIPNAERFFYIRYAFQAGLTIDEIYDLTRIDRWFLFNMKEIFDIEEELVRYRFHGVKRDLPVWKKDFPAALLRRAKECGFSDVQLAHILGVEEETVRRMRKKLGLNPVYKLVDTCAGEFKADRPYYYSSFETLEESHPSDREKVIILGGGPNRIGQGIEFDYCCVHASLALRELGYESIMVNSNPETVSTDYDTSDKLYFEPLTREDVLNIIEREKPVGVIVQFGGQTPLNLAVPLEKAGVPIWGTTPDSIDRAEDRKRFQMLLKKLNLIQPDNGTARSYEEAQRVANKIGYPVIVRPSYVLGGRAMEIVYDDEALGDFVKKAIRVSPEHPILIDKFLEDAIEIDVDALSDGETTIIGGIMEHIEEAGVHSGDSASVIPPHTLDQRLVQVVKDNTYALARELHVSGLMNIQYAIRNDVVYVLEVNPRASRTVPFVSKATGVPLAKLATKVMAGRTLAEMGLTKEVEIRHVAVKESVFPFARFPGVDAILGPEMRSTGEVMGIDVSFGKAFGKSQIAAGTNLPQTGKVFISVMNKDKRQIVFLAKQMEHMGFSILATAGTGGVLKNNDIAVQILPKLSEGRPNVIDLMKNREVALIINTSGGKKPRADTVFIRSTAVLHNVPLITTMSGAQAAVNAIEAMRKEAVKVRTIQEYHQEIGIGR
ncbi:MAG: carbamoyl-phosphate synthase large subunit [Syntrophales bacterium]|nr:carbamoyl-phosphate synthase large subunit [Syntrophales bacterium]MDD4338567.1 carbamoyl-phosphate synthase large subunit [Syntrophales bacterium]HPB69790.1 carbamoyl-phosphate synthase large subunit [Syntrophales bacterium]HQN24882.1 carbamoyl-phosphate synthase large subunit [Syntrophales bacterium]HQP28127.1 carbamoyl-phosphate synthase large subunit [Syntrophales bacterium]